MQGLRCEHNFSKVWLVTSDKGCCRESSVAHVRVTLGAVQQMRKCALQAYAWFLWWVWRGAGQHLTQPPNTHNVQFVGLTACLGEVWV